MYVTKRPELSISSMLRLTLVAMLLLTIFLTVIHPVNLQAFLSQPSQSVSSQSDASDSTLDSTTQALPAGIYPALLDAQQTNVSAAYYIQPDGSAANSAQGLTARFTTEGVQLSPMADQAQATMQLLRASYVGRPDLTLASSIAPRSGSNLVEYYRASGVTEWYVNGPLGLEQGFTLAQPASPASHFQLDLGFSGISNVSLSSAADSLDFSLANGTNYNYGGLYVYDANHQPLAAHFQLQPASTASQSYRLSIVVDLRNATYPITVDPMLRQFQRLTEPMPAQNDHFGIAIALNDDATVALVGAPDVTVGGNTAQGVAYLFSRPTAADQFTLMQVLSDTVNGQAESEFGVSVALNDTGTTALIGAYGTQVAGKDFQGAAYIFTRTNTNQLFNETQLLTDNVNGQDYDNFGNSVALSADGTVALIGAFLKSYAASTALGAAYIFTLQPATGQFSQTQFLQDQIQGNSFDEFGTAVALSRDADVALIGAPGKTINGHSNQGGAYIYTRSDTASDFTLADVLSDTTSGNSQDGFGSTVALSDDDTVAMIAAPYKTVNGKSAQGEAYLFDRPNSDTNFTLQDVLTDALTGAASDNFGSAMALSDDGKRVIIGASNKQVGANQQQGQAYIFTRTATTQPFVQSQLVTRTTGAASDSFGSAVAFNWDGTSALVSAKQKTVNNNAGAGAVYVYREPPASQTTLSFNPVMASYGQSINFTATVTSSDPNTFPTGNLILYLDSQPVYTTTITGTASSVVVTFTQTGLSVGTHYVYAAYRGGSLDDSQSVPDNVWVNPIATQLSLTSNPNPSIFGEVVTFTASLSPTAATGVVTFTEGATVLASVSVSNGVASFATGALTGGSHVISATYSGDSIYATSNSQPITQVVNSANAALILTSAPNPSTAGATVTFTATAGSAAATGVVTFTEGANVLTVSPVSNGVATFITNTLSVGSHTIAAAYSGDASHSASGPVTITQVVNAVATTITLTSSPNPSTAGFSTFFTAIVSPSAATGVVTFTEGANVLAVSPLSSGSASFNTTTLSVGTHIIAAVYSGDATYSGSGPVTITQIVNAACDPAVVTSVTDDESCGTLRYAIDSAASSPSKTVTINLAAGSIISLTTGITLSPGVIITTTASCGNTPPIIVQGVGANSGPGITFSQGNQLYGLWIKGFSGRQLVAPSGGGNKLKCVRAG